jgi:hypothetical protein
MLEELAREREETLATERGRSPSGVASVRGPAAPVPTEAHPAVFSPGDREGSTAVSSFPPESDQGVEKAKAPCFRLP